MKTPFLFIDRDGTLIEEPATDRQVDRLDKLVFEPYVIPSLLALSKSGYVLVMVSNQDGLGTDSFSKADFDGPHLAMMRLFDSQGIHFDSVLICPHLPESGCICRKPGLGLVMKYLREGKLDYERSRVIGDRPTDMQLAENMGIEGIRYDRNDNDWRRISRMLVNQPRMSTLERKTRETSISVKVDLDPENGNLSNHISTGIAFFDHMLDQVATHGGFSLSLACKGDIKTDDHHTIEDCAIALGEVLGKALGNKRGIGRYGFVLPMDESGAHCSIDLSGRSFLVFDANFSREKVGDMSTEMVSHFFRSFSDALSCTLHMRVSGSNNHHMVESLFKSLGRTLRQAIRQEGSIIPSSKGCL